MKNVILTYLSTALILGALFIVGAETFKECTISNTTIFNAIEK